MLHSTRTTSHTLTHPDGASTPTTYDLCEKFIRPCALGIILHGMVQVLQLLVAYPSQLGHQLLQLGPQAFPPLLTFLGPVQQHPHLLVVVRPNLRLDRLCARHGRLAPHDGRRPPQNARRRRPDGSHGRRAYAVLGDDVVEVLVVARLLVVHVLHQRSQMGMRPRNDGRLGGIDEDGGEFARLVYPQCRREKFALLGRKRPYRLSIVLCLWRRWGCGCAGEPPGGLAWCACGDTWGQEIENGRLPAAGDAAWYCPWK